ncbi:MAG: L,D-transpeptidase, partial [Myxococcales bacterium]|nr:L,D-transpeptidase [Myxococcales bacterium]
KVADKSKSKSKAKVAEKQSKSKKATKVAKKKPAPAKPVKEAKKTEKKVQKRTLFSRLFENEKKQDKAPRKTLASNSLKKTDTLALAPTTMEFDGVAAQKAAAAKGLIDPKFDMQIVPFNGYKKGTIVIDSQNKFLYLVEGWGKARRYGVAVGREGLGWTGTATVHDKTEWPRWIPTKEMIERDPGHYKQYEDGMDGGPTNPLGARAMYLWQG